jgi:hypothetical protein
VVEARKGGGVRRGPFAGKRSTFATRLTEGTMSRLADAAERQGLSISQLAEGFLVSGLSALDDYERLLAPHLQSFQQKMQGVLAARRTGDQWAEAAKALVEQLSLDLNRALRSPEWNCDSGQPSHSRAQHVAPNEPAALGGDDEGAGKSTKSVGAADQKSDKKRARTGRLIDLGPDRPEDDR